MTRIGRVGVLGAVSVWLAFGAAAADLSKFSEAERQQINDWMAKRAELMIEAGRLDREVGAAWTNEAYTSAEIDALLDRLHGVQNILRKTAEKKKDFVVPGKDWNEDTLRRFGRVQNANPYVKREYI